MRGLGLGDGLYQFRARCNCYLVRGTRKDLLIDAGLPRESGSLEAQRRLHRAQRS